MAGTKTPDRPDRQAGPSAGRAGALAGDQAARPAPCRSSGEAPAGDEATSLQRGGTRSGDRPGAALGGGGGTGFQKRNGS